MVRAYVEGELKTLGYRVIVTRNAPAALEVLRGPENIHVLFSDVVMPGGMFGTELAKEAARLRPHLKILLTSGHTEHPVLGAGPVVEHLAGQVEHRLRSVADQVVDLAVLIGEERVGFAVAPGDRREHLGVGERCRPDGESLEGRGRRGRVGGDGRIGRCGD